MTLCAVNSSEISLTVICRPQCHRFHIQYSRSVDRCGIHSVINELDVNDDGDYSLSGGQYFVYKECSDNASYRYQGFNLLSSPLSHLQFLKCCVIYDVI